MCFVWQNPTDPREEITADVLAKLPGGFDNVNISGGEPTLRKDLHELVDVLHPKARVLEISSNGMHPDRLVPIIKKFPDIKVRFSLEGDKETNATIRGENQGFEIKMNGLRLLREAGGKDLGFAMVIQDENADQLVSIYDMTRKLDFELATSTLHNGWQFYKNDNSFYDRVEVAKKVQKLVTAMLESARPKNWFRAYLNLGLIEKILGHERLIECSAGTKFAFIDPWSDVWACNVRCDMPLGNLARQPWEEILQSPLSKEACAKVGACDQNCWMVTTARTAMRSSLFPGVPKFGPLTWVLYNKLRSVFGRQIEFERYIDYSNVRKAGFSERTSFLGTDVKGRLVRGRDTPQQRYPLQLFDNR